VTATPCGVVAPLQGRGDDRPVERGRAIVGQTGDVGVGRVHFGLSPVCADGDWFVRRGVIWSWPCLDSWRGGGNADPAPEANRWAKQPGCPDTPSVEP
jgi:hypothetical protein